MCSGSFILASLILISIVRVKQSNHLQLLFSVQNHCKVTELHSAHSRMLNGSFTDQTWICCLLLNCLAFSHNPSLCLWCLSSVLSFILSFFLYFSRLCSVSGLSPFMGDNDNETLANVTSATWDFEDEAFDEISDEAKDFISNLLKKDMSWVLSNCCALICTTLKSTKKGLIAESFLMLNRNTFFKEPL